MNGDTWDGHERRMPTPPPATNGASTRPTVEVPATAVVAALAGIALLLAGVLWALIIHSGNQKAAGQDAREFRQQLSCFVIRVSQGTPGPETLERCGFLSVGGVR